MTEACSGRHGDLGAITWCVATGSASISNGHEAGLAGSYSPTSNRIVLADTAGLDGADVRHEMLHAPVGVSVASHPRDEFLGRCAGTVRCIETRISEAGPPPPPDRAAVAVGPAALRVSGVIDPVAPSVAIDDGWFTFSVLVTKPRATPVSVGLAPSGDLGLPVSFRWDATGVRVLAPCGTLQVIFAMSAPTILLA
jgi:hypothetical protein